MKTTIAAAPPAPQPVDAGKASIDYVREMASPELQSQLLASEQQFRPQYNALNLQDIQQYLTGQSNIPDWNAYAQTADVRAAYENQLASDPNARSAYPDINTFARDYYKNVGQAQGQTLPTVSQPGALDLLEMATIRSGEIQSQANTAARQADIADVANLGASASAAFRAANPELYAQLSAAQGMGGQSNYFSGLQQAIQGAQPIAGAQFSPMQAALIGQTPTYSAQNAAQVADISSRDVGPGQLGQQLYNQALQAGTLGATATNLQGQAQRLSQSTGQLNPDEVRAIQQATRESYAARGLDMSNPAIAAEAMARSDAVRQRQMQDLAAASSLNQAVQQEIGANRSFQQSVQAADVSRQQSNAASALQAALANQGVSAQRSALNQAAQNQAGQFNAQQAMQGLLSNQSSQNQASSLNSQLGLQSAISNRDFLAQQQQQGIANQGTLGQLLQGQGAADRAYALQLAGAYGGTTFDPMMAILGRQSTAVGTGQQQQGYSTNLMSSLQGPQLFDPNAGINLALQNNANSAGYNSAIYGAQAAQRGAAAQGTGAMIGGALGGLGAFLGCWVAREVFGHENPKWLMFREWLFTKAPKWFKWLYLRYGERFARFISNKPRMKNVIRKWMEKRIQSIN